MVIQKCVLLLACASLVWAVPHSTRPTAQARDIIVRVGVDSRGEHRLIRVEPYTDAESLDGHDKVAKEGDAGQTGGPRTATESQAETSQFSLFATIARWRSKLGTWARRIQLEMTRASERPEPDPDLPDPESTPAYKYEQEKKKKDAEKKKNKDASDAEKAKQEGIDDPTGILPYKIPLTKKHFGLFILASIGWVCYAYLYWTQVVDAIRPMTDASPGIKEQDLKFSPTSCFQDQHLALHMLFCLVPRNAQTYHVAGLMNYWAAIAMQTLCPCLCCCWSVYFKGLLKEKLNAEDNANTDCLPYFCGCCMCADGASAMAVDERVEVKVECCLKVVHARDVMY